MYCQHISSALCLIQCRACSGITSSQAFIKISLLQVSKQPVSLEFKHGGESGTRRAVRWNKNISRLALDSINWLLPFFRQLCRCTGALGRGLPSRHPQPVSGWATMAEQVGCAPAPSQARRITRASPLASHRLKVVTVSPSHFM